MSASVALATAEELGAVLELLRRGGLLLDGLADHFANAVVARKGKRVVGCAALEIYNNNAALLRSVAVDAVHQGSGLGHRLVEAAVRLALERRLENLYLLTTTAAEFFPRFGFEHISREQVSHDVRESAEFRSACPENAVVMRKRLKRETEIGERH